MSLGPTQGRVCVSILRVHTHNVSAEKKSLSLLLLLLLPTYPRHHEYNLSSCRESKRYISLKTIMASVPSVTLNKPARGLWSESAGSSREVLIVHLEVQREAGTSGTRSRGALRSQRGWGKGHVTCRRLTSQHDVTI